MNETEQWKYWHDRYTAIGDDYLYGTEANKFVMRQAKRLKPGMTALSVADGEGRNSVWLAERGLSVTALEFSPLAVDKARRLARERQVEVNCLHVDIFKWDWPTDAYDVVLATFIQFASPAQRAFLFKSMKHALKPGGMVMVHGYTTEQLKYKTGGPSNVDYLYTEALMREAFGNLKFLELHEYEDILEEGSGSQRHHSGRSALMDVVAKRPD